MSPRPLTPAEHALFVHLLSNMGGRAEQLLPHLEGAEVADDDLPATDLRLTVRPEVVPVDLPDAPIPGSAVVEGPGGEILGELFLYTFEGLLDSLYLAPYADERPTAMPEIDAIRISPAPRWA